MIVIAANTTVNTHYYVWAASPNDWHLSTNSLPPITMTCYDLHEEFGVLRLSATYGEYF